MRLATSHNRTWRGVLGNNCPCFPLKSGKHPKEIKGANFSDDFYKRYETMEPMFTNKMNDKEYEYATKFLYEEHMESESAFGKGRIDILQSDLSQFKNSL